MWLPTFRGLGRMSDMWREMDRLQREMNRLFSGETVTFAPNYPAINLWFSENNVIVTSEIPGVDPADIEIAVEGDVLTLSGSRPRMELNEGETYHRQERAHGSFRRKVQLPFRTDVSKVEAKYEKGVLSVALSRVEEDKPKKIQIKTD